MPTKTEKHGIELRWKRGRKLRLQSYAVYVHGVCYVSHDTTQAMDSESLKEMIGIEKQRTGLPII